MALMQKVTTHKTPVRVGYLVVVGIHQRIGKVISEEVHNSFSCWKIEFTKPGSSEVETVTKIKGSVTTLPGIKINIGV